MMYDRIVTSVLGPVSFLMKFPFNQKKKKKKKRIFKCQHQWIKDIALCVSKKKKKKKKYIALLAMELDLIPRFMVTACAT